MIEIEQLDRSATHEDATQVMHLSELDGCDECRSAVGFASRWQGGSVHVRPGFEVAARHVLHVHAPDLLPPDLWAAVKERVRLEREAHPGRVKGDDERWRLGSKPAIVAQQVRLIRLAAEHPDWSARQLAREVKCSPTTASKYRRGWTVTNG